MLRIWFRALAFFAATALSAPSYAQEIFVSPSPVEFGQIHFTNNKNLPFAITNSPTSERMYTVLGIRILGADVAAFTLGALPAFPFQLGGAGSGLRTTLRFRPSTIRS